MDIKKLSRDDFIDVSTWKKDESYEGVFPVGARPKSAIYCPTDIDEIALVPGKKYLFKKSFERYPDQFWMERVAYIVGCFMGIEVPTTFVAYDSSACESGALIEWFYDENHPDFRSYIDGTMLFVSLIEDFDTKTGKQHNLEMITSISKALRSSTEFFIESDFLTHFLRMMIFDSIIGNTDRHQENWGLVLYNIGDNKRKVVFSPAFDNGTSLGHEIVQQKIGTFKNPQRMSSYLRKGKHHIRWNIKSPDRIGHFELFESMKKSKEFVEIVMSMLSFDFEELENEVRSLSSIDGVVPLSRDRVQFIMDLLRARVRHVMMLLGVSDEFNT